MEKKELIKDLKPKNKIILFLRKGVKNFYILSFLFVLFLIIWFFLIDGTAMVIINLNKEIEKYEDQLEYYKQEYKKNDDFYKRLMNNKDEKEKYARENYFMKKPNEEIFILVVDSADVSEK